MWGRPYGPLVLCVLSCVACQKDDVVVGVSWPEYQQERWAMWDEPAVRSTLEDAGATYVSTDADGDADKQNDDIDDLIAQDADAIIVIANDTAAVLPAVGRALDAGVAVIAYDRLIEDSDTFFLSFDNVEVGRMEARPLLEAAPTGNYVLIKGDPNDPNADLLRQGQVEVLQDAIDASDIVIVSETYTDYWDPAGAESQMAAVLDANSNDIDAVLSQNDGLAGGAIAALEAEGLDGLVPVSGQDGDWDALNRVALGTQTVSVWKDARDLGEAAALAALDLAAGTALEDLDGTTPFESPEGNTLTSILLDPLPITADNLDVVLDAGWIDEEALCDGVPTGTVDACP